MLPSLTVAFITGLLVGSQIPYFPLSASFLLFLLALGTVVLESLNRFSIRNATWLYGALLVGVVYWSVAVNLTAHDPMVESSSDAVIEVTGRIVAPVQQAPDQLIMIIRSDDPIDESGASRHVRLTWRTPERMFFQGDRVGFRAILRRPSGSLNPGGFNYAVYIERQGIDAIATVTGSDAVQFLESGRAHAWWAIWNQFDRWRGSIRMAAVQTLPQPALGLYLGIIIGDRGYLDPDLRDQFMVTGTVHLLSISGSHLGLVALFIFAVVRWVVLLLPTDWLLALSRRITPTRVAAVWTLLPVAGYACLAGAELATMRSLLMVTVGLSAIWLGQERRLFHALSAAAVGILLHDPQALFDISFQLSFLSVIAIAGWLSWPTVGDVEELPNEPSFLRTCARWGRDSVVMSGVVTLVTVPLVAYYFNQLPWLGLITNVVAVPVMGILLVPIGLGAGIWQIVVGGTMLPLASLNQWLLEYFVAAIRLVSILPGGEWHVAAPSALTMLLFYGCLVLLWQRVGRPAFRLAAGAGVLLVLLWWAWSPRMFLDGDHFRVTFLDVGQGDSAVVELPDGQVVLIDGGAAYERFDMGRAVVAPYLWNRGIHAIDQVIGTHPQLDHVGGLAWVVRHFIVKRYWGSGETREELFYRRLQQSLADQGLQEQVAREGQEIVSSSSCRMVVLNPPADEQLDVRLHHDSHLGGHVLNNRSVVTRLICGTHTMLFAADVERDGLSRMTDSTSQDPIEVLKVPHHGALSSLNRDWLASLHPQYAVFSAGRHNPYRHPAASVLGAYGSEGSMVLRTDRDGGVWFAGRISDGVLHVHRARELEWQPTNRASCLWTCEQENWARVWKQWRDPD
ncbi:MAG TPA: DNA internalization-related competence protein ComEC/Rec2 [Nitrospiraceae bacterium]|jgi:competence protein ComEC|nr:DNA internalization-related competence protein ComEC/Rec2 [Nitrospiraceae bacterium]